MKWANGDVYIGSFRNGYITGRGVKTIAYKNQRYEGNLFVTDNILNVLLNYLQLLMLFFFFFWILNILSRTSGPDLVHNIQFFKFALKWITLIENNQTNDIYENRF